MVQEITKVYRFSDGYFIAIKDGRAKVGKIDTILDTRVRYLENIAEFDGEECNTLEEILMIIEDEREKKKPITPEQAYLLWKGKRDVCLKHGYQLLTDSDVVDYFERRLK